MNSSPQPMPPWFLTLIGEGLAGLYLLNLEGCPAADAAPAVRLLWASLLWNTRRIVWEQDCDSWRIREAFVTMAANFRRWPAPIQFWDALPNRPPAPLALPGSVTSIEDRKRNIERLRKEAAWIFPSTRDDDGIEEAAP